jgi:outer membrane immunogenic protein
MYKVSKLAAGSVIAATAALGTASVALADGYEPRRVAYERPMDWSGVYFGVSSGYQWSSIEVKFPDAGTKFTSDHNDALVDAHIGLQHQFGVIVVGVEAGWASTLRTNHEDWVTCPNPDFQCSARINDILTVGGRLGYAAGRWMPYVTGGYANAGFDMNARTLNAAPTGTFGATTLRETAHARDGGWYLGGGVEWAVSPGWSAGIEYRHYEFGSVTTNDYNPATGTFVERVRFADPSTDSVSARVSWRWGRPEAAPLK